MHRGGFRGFEQLHQQIRLLRHEAQASEGVQVQPIVWPADDRICVAATIALAERAGDMGDTGSADVRHTLESN